MALRGREKATSDTYQRFSYICHRRTIYSKQQRVSVYHKIMISPSFATGGEAAAIDERKILQEITMIDWSDKLHASLGLLNGTLLPLHGGIVQRDLDPRQVAERKTSR